jgi:vacuolar-type H+-ATPase subunit F/Vma7
MSRLLVLTRKTLLPGFQLAGVDAFGIEDIETAQELIENWLKDKEIGLLAIDEGLLEQLDPSLIKLLDNSDTLTYLIIPGGGPLGQDISRRHRISEMIRRAIGSHITFKGEEAEKT